MKTNKIIAVIIILSVCFGVLAQGNDSLSGTKGPANIVVGNKKIRAYGWGEYRVGGRCFCCDNPNDGDCIFVHNIERTNRERIPQIVDGKIEGDISDQSTYFGKVKRREHPEPVDIMIAELSLGKMYEISKVIVYTLKDNKNVFNFLDNCELGYYNQFDRLQWTGMVENKKSGEPITFTMKNPVLTKKLLLKTNSGNNIITEVAIYCE